MLLYAKPAHVARPDEKNGTALPQSMTYQPYTYAPKGGKALPHHDIRNHRASCVMGGSGDDFRKDGLMACGPAGRTAPAAPAAGGQTGQRRRLAPPHFGPLSGNQGPGRTRQPAASRAFPQVGIPPCQAGSRGKYRGPQGPLPAPSVRGRPDGDEAAVLSLHGAGAEYTGIQNIQKQRLACRPSAAQAVPKPCEGPGPDTGPPDPSCSRPGAPGASPSGFPKGPASPIPRSAAL